MSQLIIVLSPALCFHLRRCYLFMLFVEVVSNVRVNSYTVTTLSTVIIVQFCLTILNKNS